MEKFKYLIVGGGVAGTTAAETIRKNDPDGTVAIVSEEPYPFYSRIMLSKPGFFLGKIPFDKIWLKNESWYEENKIALMKGKKAVNLDPENKILKLDDGTEIKYEKLLIAIGGCARKWNVPGADKDGVCYLRTLDDAKNIIEKIKTAKKAVMIGGGFISFELSHLFRETGLDVNLIIRKSYYWESLLDEDSGKMIEKALKDGGVKIFYNSEVKEVIGDQSVKGVLLKDDTKLDCDMIVCGIGVVCPYQVFKDCGLEVDKAILADEYLKTNLPDVWVAGDAAEYKDIILEERVIMGNWASAQKQGEVAGLNMVGKDEQFKFVSFYTTEAFGITIAFVGNVRPGENKKIIKRGSSDMNSYGRLIMMNDELVGATLINRTNELIPIKKLIENNIKVADKEKELSDPSFDLNKII